MVKWNGNTKKYNQERKVFFDGEYKIEKKKEINEDGKLKSHKWADKMEEFYPNGKIKFEGIYFYHLRDKKGEKWEGIFKENDDNGNSRNEGKYIEGKK